MKKSAGLLFASLTLSLVMFAASISIEQVLSALKSGNASELSKYFDSRVDISLPDKSDNYSKNQAEMILRDFFTANEVKSFEVKHKGENNGAQFCIGILQTRNGVYRTKLYMKQKGNRQLIQEISFRSEE